jgi:phospholipid/cholesterol/gamma-HCH transport system substrate-binding protein
METRVRYVVVGLFVLAIGLAGLAFALWIQNRGSLEGKRAVLVRFLGPAPGLRIGAPVTFNGVRVGEVTRLAFSRTNLSQLDAFVSIDPETPLSTTTQVSVESQGLLGSAYVAMAGGDPQSPLTSTSGSAMLEAPPATSLTQDARAALRGIQSVVGDNSAPLRDLIGNLATFSSALSRNSDKVDSIIDGLSKLAGGSDKAAPKATFDLAAPSKVEGFTPPGGDVTLVVNDPTSIVALDTQRLLDKSADGQISPTGVEWTDTIPKLVQKKLLQTFDRIGYHSANTPMDGGNPTYQLALEIRNFQIEEDGQSPHARIELGARLLGDDGKIVAGRTVAADVPAAGMEPKQLAAAMNEAFGKTIGDLVLWFGETARP